MTDFRHAAYDQRIPVEVRSDPDADDRALASLFARAPTRRVERLADFGFVYREEPPVFLAVAAVATLLLGLLGHVAACMPHARGLGHVLAVVFDLCAVALGVRFVRATTLRIQVVARGVAFCVRRCAWGSKPSEVGCLAEELTAALLVGVAGQRRVLMVGARNAHVLDVFTERWMDPPTLMAWMVEASARVASRAAGREA